MKLRSSNLSINAKLIGNKSSTSISNDEIPNSDEVRNAL